MILHVVFVRRLGLEQEEKLSCRGCTHVPNNCGATLRASEA